MYDVIVIGGGTAGLTAAIYILRAGKSVLVLESENFGGQITFSPRIENYPGFKSISGNEFADSLVSQALDLGADVELDKVTALKADGIFKKVFTERGEYICKSVIIATGAKHRHLGIEREEDLEGSGISYCAVCDGAFFKNQNVAVVGGGSAALQSAMHLSAFASKVYLIHRRDSFRGESYLAENLRKKQNIEFVLDSEVKGLAGDSELEAITVNNKKTNEITTLDVSGLFVAIGQQPDNRIFEDTVNIDDAGYIVAGEDCKTSADGIFVAGDCRTKSVRQLTTASADGAVSGLAASAYAEQIN